jgi:hypothetical protein
MRDRGSRSGSVAPGPVLRLGDVARLVAVSEPQTLAANRFINFLNECPLISITFQMPLY